MAVNPYTKIHIIGGPGSGKTYLGKRMANHLSVPVCDLDNLFWDNKADNYNTKATEQDRANGLATVLAKPQWIIEGVYYSWLQTSFKEADVIIIIQSNDVVRNYRIIKRFIQRKLGFIQSKKDNLKGLIALIKWGQAYSTEKIPEILKATEDYKAKRYFFKNADTAFDFLVSNPVKQ